MEVHSEALHRGKIAVISGLSTGHPSNFQYSWPFFILLLLFLSICGIYKHVYYYWGSTNIKDNEDKPEIPWERAAPTKKSAGGAASSPTNLPV